MIARFALEHLGTSVLHDAAEWEQAERQRAGLLGRVQRLPLKELARGEGGITALAIRPGQLAVATALILAVPVGRNVVIHRTLSVQTRSVFLRHLPDLGIETRWFDASDPSSLDSSVDQRTAAVYLETAPSPGSGLPDLAALGAETRRRGLLLVADNTIMGSHQVRPLELGADVVVYSDRFEIGRSRDPGDQEGAIIIGRKAAVREPASIAA